MLVEAYEKINKERANLDLDKYFNTITLKRQKGKGMFCGMDYVAIKKLRPIEYYSRFNHCKNTAYTASKLTDNLCIQLAGALHDVGVCSFAHVNSFKKGEALTQENDELNVKNIILQDEELLTYLHEDQINIDDVCDASKYNLIDKEIPALCLDRADGILTTCLIWQHTHSIEEISELYDMLGYVDTLNGMCFDLSSKRLREFDGEVVLNEWFPGPGYEDFFKAINVYSKVLLSKESRYMMEVFGLMLNYYEDIGLIDEKDLFYLSEEEIINKILDSKYKDVWCDVTSFDKVRYAKDNSKDDLIIMSKPKIRQANPLCCGQMEVCEIDGISGDFYRELNPIIDDIILTDKPLIGNLSNYTKKILTKYQK